MHRMVCSSPLNDALIGTLLRRHRHWMPEGLENKAERHACRRADMALWIWPESEGKGLLASVELEGEENGCSLSFSWFVIACFTWKNCIFADEWRDNCITV